MEPLIAFLIGVAVTVLVASLTVLITLRVRNYFEEGEDSGRGGRKGKKTGRGKRGGPKVTPDKREGEYTIRFRDAGSSGKTWTCQIDDELIIGRGEDCDIQLSDKSVSRPHCKIFIGENGLEVADLGAKHRTKRNGVFVYSGSPLERGDTLRLGREELLVESIRHLGREEPERRDDAGPDATSDVDEEEQAPHRKQSRRSSDTVPASPWNEAQANSWDEGRDNGRQGEDYAQEAQRRERSQGIKDSSDTKGVW